MVIKRLELPCIRDKDLRNVLEAQDIAQKIDRSELLCESCSEIITWDTIGAILVREGTIVVCCDLPDCIEKFSKMAK